MESKRIGLDFHKVISADPQFFYRFCLAANAEGFEIYIISGGPEKYVRQFLRQQQIEYDCLWCIFDYYKDKEKVIYHSDGSFMMNDEVWNRAKAEYCRAHKIAVHIDDSLIYGKYFTTPYCLYNPQTKNGLIGDCEVNFDADAAEVLQNILAIING